MNWWVVFALIIVTLTLMFGGADLVEGRMNWWVVFALIIVGLALVLGGTDLP